MTTTIPGARCITDDNNHYFRSVTTYDNKVVEYTFSKVWLQKTFPETIVAKLRENFPDVKQLRMLNVGSGNGEIDCTMLKHIRAKFESIDNHVVEPSGDMLSEYKSRVNNFTTCNQLADVSCTWNQQGLDEYMTSPAGSESGKFHLISAMHSLYYVKNQGASIDYLHDKLAEGGLLIIMMQDENCGYLKIHRRYPLYNGANDLLAALPKILTHLKDRKIHYDQELLSASCDVTSCYQGTEEGSYIIDFLSHIMNFEKVAPSDLQKEFLEYVRSAECARVDGDKVFLNSDETALVIERK
ncbi:histamine N-methyltransferase-like [Amphiura filiformis]|uniref:histamine N-methyltransferase-like n=1 Tax=Amphiura filiformis TaxID=82378 RepID=UPI003B213A10